MKTFHQLYLDILQQEAGKGRVLEEDCNPYHMDCLLHPQRHAPVIFAEECEQCAYDRACENSCIFDAFEQGEDGKVHINKEKCTGCGACVDACKLEKLAANKDVVPVLQAVRREGQEVYALAAPAFLGQFGADVTTGKLRAAFKAMGFQGLIEVAVFADILTLKEALEFDANIRQEQDYQLTSCCCPVWIAMIRKVYKELMPHVPGAVSPMVSAGRVVKKLHPGAVTVFVGPCMAKKKEAREPDIADAVDYVLTFQEVQDMFEAADIHPGQLGEDEKEHSSRAGRIYARTGGVSEAVKETVKQLNPDRKIAVRAEQADGVPACREMIERLKRGETDANFFEGMGCPGGCVGGPGSIIGKEEGRKNVEQYGAAAEYKTPLENPFVPELLARLGFHTIDEFLEKSDILVRDFSA
ncbi:MAG: 4Fe-4S binding protein [Lachnospiraceae bacterium]|nr:4Fe-4S binding protein [Lachnospiraceae bacterium]